MYYKIMFPSRIDYINDGGPTRLYRLVSDFAADLVCASTLYDVRTMTKLPNKTFP
jgi:hypothetical protein